MRFQNTLNEEIQDELQNLGQMELGSDQYQKTVEGISKLMDRSIEMKKFDAEMTNKETCQANDLELRVQQLEAEKKDNKIRNGITIAGIVIPTAVTIWGTLKSFKFEESGTVTTIMGRGFINKLLPKK